MSTASVATRRTVPTASWPPAPTIGTPAWPRGARNPEGQPACPGGATLEVWSEPHPNRAGVCVYAPSTIVTVTIEVGHDDSDEVHFHAGGQGFWIARLLGRLGVPTTMCSAFGGEAGRVARSLVEAEPIEVRAVETSDENGSWVHDRRRGERQTLADVPGSALRRHVADELYGVGRALLATADRREIHRFLDRIELVPLG